MASWNEYLGQLLSQKTKFDSVIISLDGNNTTIPVPPVIKASVLMLDHMLENMGKRNVLIFPEKSQTLFLFVLMKLLHNISTGRIAHHYDPEEFDVGEMLKLGNAVAQCLGPVVDKGEKLLRLKFSDGFYSAPVELLPFLQRTSTAKKLSKSVRFYEEKAKVNKKIKLAELVGSPVTLLSQYKTHMESSIYYMSTITSSKKSILDCWLDDSRIDSLMLIGQANYEGKIQNIGPGQLKGIPAIVLASDLYTIRSTVEQGNPVQSIIIDASNSNQILTQLDALDELLKLEVPVVCIADTANSFELEELQKRHFNIWRWNNANLTPELYIDADKPLSRRLANCARQTVDYVYAESSALTKVMRCISAHRKDVQDKSPQMMQIFETLNRLTFSAIRETVSFSKMEVDQAEQKLVECLDLLNAERPFISSADLDDYNTAIDRLMQIYEDRDLPKRIALKNKLKEVQGKSIVLIVPDHADKDHIGQYWRDYIRKSALAIELTVATVSEYLGNILPSHDMAIVIGWLRRDRMRRIIYSYRSRQYSILLYECEKRWCGHDVRQWHRILMQSDNKAVIEKSFRIGKQAVSAPPMDSPDPLPQVEAAEADELEEISRTVQDNRYRRFAGKTRSGSEPTEALPVNFIGDYIAFFRKGHSLISATKIITEDEEKIEQITPEKIQIGDFIVMRETGRDLIREMADRILNRAGKGELRNLATKWKESIRIALIFTSIDEFYEKLKAAGCTKGFQTIWNWAYDEKLIAPNDKEDLELIAKVSADPLLKEMLDRIYNASREVRAAHTQAGMDLSRLLRARIAEELKSMGDIDPYNIWEPLEMDLEEIGTVRILKVIDVNGHRFMMVDASDTNRLMFNE